MIIELTKRIKVIRPEAKAMFPYSNSVFIEDDCPALIDAGSGGRAYADIPVDEVKMLILSHNHFDHVNGISFFPNAQIMVGSEEAETYKDPEAYYHFTGFNQWERLMGEVDRASYAVAHSVLPDDVPGKRGFQYVEYNGLIKDGDVIELGETSIKAIHTPGHSPGHYAFYFEKEGILFSGDLDLAPDGPWYAGGFSDFDLLINSVQRLIDISPRLLITSHRRLFDARHDDIPGLLQAFLDVSLKKEEQSLIYLTQPRTIDDIASQDFIHDFQGKHPFTSFFSKMMIDKHLKRLVKNGKVRKLDSDHYIRVD